MGMRNQSTEGRLPGCGTRSPAHSCDPISGSATQLLTSSCSDRGGDQPSDLVDDIVAVLVDHDVFVRLSAHRRVTRQE